MSPRPMKFPRKPASLLTALPSLIATLSPLAADPVINEFHYKPADSTSLEEFIEIHNPEATQIDLTGWTLQDAVTFSFPSGTVIAPGGYVVIAENPSVIQTKFGVTALGPWIGKLSSDGEDIELRDPSGELRDRVNYGSGFPWPTAAAGAGSSCELLDPSLDNDLSGSWRSSGTLTGPTTITYISPSDSDWKYRKGLSEASSPVDAWRAIDYDDSSWSSGQAPIGYGTTVSCNTVLGDMRNNYSTVYGRKSFSIPAGEIPDSLTLHLRFDDGCVVSINGQEIARPGMPGTGETPYNATADQTVSTAAWSTLELSNTASYLVSGTNVLTIHGANITVGGSSDFSFDAELLHNATATVSTPTPGVVNSVKAIPSQVPPQIRQVDHLPVSPAPGESVAITAKITDPDGMGAVSLEYQIVDPGTYIRLSDPAYTANWTSIPMRDDATGGDELAGDSIFTANIPASIQTNRRLVRYRIHFTDSIGNSETAPFSDDEQPNFAYYVYSGLPTWQGSFRPGETALKNFTSDVLDDVPVYSLIADNDDVINSQYNGGWDAVRFRGTFIYDGIVYDHIEFRNRGEASTYQSGKNKWRFFFNRARDLPASDNFGDEYEESWGSFSANACASPWVPVNRGMAGVEEAAAYKIYDLAGLPSPNTHYYHFRIIRGADETPTAGSVVNDSIGNADGQYAGDFWGLYLAVEQPDGSFLDERGLPDGNIYKIEDNNGDQKNQSTAQVTDGSDWVDFRNAHTGGNPSEAWWRANMDMDSYYTFQALNRLTGNVDLRGGYNHYFYHRSSDGRWVPIPWDLDMMFIAKNHWSGVIDANKSITQHPALALEYRNRCRELLDLLASDGNPGGGQIGQLIDEFSAIVNPAGQPLTLADADAAMWNLHPRTRGNDGDASGQGNHRGNFYRTTFLDTRIGGNWTRWLRSPGSSGTMEHEDSMDYLRDYATNTWPGGTWTVNNGSQRGYGYQYLAYEASDSNIPATPLASSVGDPSYPIDRLTFTASDFSDPQGPGTYAGTQWRMAEISGPGVPGHVAGTPRKYEIHPIWTEETSSATASISIPYGVATPGASYRVRARHQDSSGRWSHWSEPAEFIATAPEPGLLLHYWNFNAPSLTTPTYSIGGGDLTASLTGSAIIRDDDGANFTAENARNADPAANHLRVNYPLDAVLEFKIPTTGYENLVIRYETRRSGQGAGIQQASYTTDGVTYTALSSYSVADGSPTLQLLDLRDITDVSDNELFTLRIAFQQGDGGTAGNNRFDNFTVEGTPIEPEPNTFAAWKSQHFTDPSDLADEAISGADANPSGDGIANLIRHSLNVGPYDPVNHLLPILIRDSPGFSFHFRYDPSQTDLIWKVVASTDLNDWSQVIFDSSSDPIPPLVDGWLPVEVPNSLNGGSEPEQRIFTRLELILTTP